MGVYTGLAKLGTKKWESRRYLGSGPPRDESQARPVEETRFICAECRQYYPFDEDCPPCGRPVVDRTVALPAARREVGRSLFGAPAEGSPMLFLLALVAVGLPLAWIPLVEHFEGSDTAGVLVVLATAAGVVIGVPTLAALVGRVRRHRASVRANTEARAAAVAMPCIRIADAPGETPEPIRVRGRIRFDVGPTAVHMRICDDSGTAVISEHAHVQARVADGSLAELDSIRHGDVVEIVGTGRRHTRAGDTYRESETELELGTEAPLQAWVLERADG